MTVRVMRIQRGSSGTATKKGGPVQRGEGEQRLEVPGSKAHVQLNDRRYLPRSKPTQVIIREKKEERRAK